MEPAPYEDEVAVVTKVLGWKSIKVDLYYANKQKTFRKQISRLSVNLLLVLLMKLEFVAVKSKIFALKIIFKKLGVEFGRSGRGFGLRFL